MIWEQYKKTFVVLQVFILACLAVLRFWARADMKSIIFTFLVMEGCAMLGAAWAMRLKRKVMARTGRLPLEGR